VSHSSALGAYAQSETRFIVRKGEDGMVLGRLEPCDDTRCSLGMGGGPGETSLLSSRLLERDIAIDVAPTVEPATWAVITSYSWRVRTQIRPSAPTRAALRAVMT
jgi:hypothetical protein